MEAEGKAGTHRLGSMTGSPLISVVMPIWRAEKFIAQTLASLKEQRYTNWELLAVADGGDTGSSSFIASFINANPHRRIVYQVMDRQVGAAEARNTGLRQAKGSLFAFLDADDLWMPGFLEECVRAISRPNLIAASPVFLIDEDNHVIGTYGPIPLEYEKPDVALCFRNFLAPAAAMMTREAYNQAGGFSSRWKIVADWALWTACCRKGYKLIPLPLPQVCYRKHGGALTSKVIEVQSEIMSFLYENAQCLAFPLRWKGWFLFFILFGRFLFSTIRWRTDLDRGFGPAYPVTDELQSTLNSTTSGPPKSLGQ